MTDPLGEALAEYEWVDGQAQDPYDVIGEHWRVVLAAARNWHALTEPTQEMVNRIGLRLAVELNHTVASFSPLVLGPNTERIARNLLDALTDTTEEEAR